jgi:Uma2 family endonuclease
MYRPATLTSSFTEYAGRGIPEMWLIDPARSVVKVLTLVDGEVIQSPTFPGLTTTAIAVLTAGE